MKKITMSILAVGMVIIVFLSSFVTLHAIVAKQIDNPTVSNGSFRLGLSYPPMKNERQRSITRYHCEKLGIDLLRMGISWSYSEPKQGSFQWSGLDNRMKFCQDNGIDVLLTINSEAPEWNVDQQTPKSSTFVNYTAFKHFLQTLFTRYQDYNIHSVQFGNEWPNSYQFIGTAEQFVNYSNTVYNTAKEIIPTTTFVLGGLATTNLRLAAAYFNYTNLYRLGNEREIITGLELEEYLASEEVKAGVERVTNVLVNATYDQLDLHLYDDYEFWSIYVEMMKDLVPGKPIIVSEFGGPNVIWEKYSNKKQAIHLNNSLAVLDKLDIEEAYYFKLIQSSSSTPQHRKSSLLNSLLTIKPSYYVMQKYSTNEISINYKYYLLSSLIITTIFTTIITAIFSISFTVIYIKKKRAKKIDTKKTNGE